MELGFEIVFRFNRVSLLEIYLDSILYIKISTPWKHHISIYGMLDPTRFSRTDKYFRGDAFFYLHTSSIRCDGILFRRHCDVKYMSESTSIPPVHLTIHFWKYLKRSSTSAKMLAIKFYRFSYLIPVTWYNAIC